MQTRGEQIRHILKSFIEQCGPPTLILCEARLYFLVKEAIEENTDAEVTLVKAPGRTLCNSNLIVVENSMGRVTVILQEEESCPLSTTHA